MNKIEFYKRDREKNIREIKLIPQLRLSMDQMKLIKILTSKYGVILGYEQPEMQDILRDEFCSLYELEWFSTSPKKVEARTMETATKFIEFMEYWHIFPIKLGPTLAALGQRLYPKQFKVFDIEKYRSKISYEVQEFLKKNKGKVFRQGLSYG